jgi:polyisoprenoid-binding protein YceI
MKNVATLSAAAVFMLASAFSIEKPVTTAAHAPASQVTLKIKEKTVDTKGSTLKWKAKKVTAEHSGTIDLTDGKLLFDGKTLTGGEFTINMSSLAVSDLTDPKTNQMLAGHLKSDDFFAVDKFASSVFKITSATQNDKKDASAYTITGDLTIKGITHPITFPAKVYVKRGEAVAYAKITVDRTLYGIKYGSGQFFAGLGDKMIEDTFELDIRMVAK